MIIVGIGASAGGLPAIISCLETFIGPPINMCFVVIQHLAPDKKSYMLDILQSKIHLPIEVVDKEVILTSGTVYLAPPGKLLSIVANKLIPSDIPSHHGPQRTIDFFFKSLSISGLYTGLGVILSGTGTDGLKGSQDLYEAGAEIFVQDPTEAEFAGMPEAVIESGFFTKKIKASELQDSINEMIHSEEKIQIERKRFQQINERIDRVSELLGENFNLKLSDYKSGTVVRRISKRIDASGMKNIDDYIQYLSDDPKEGKALFEEIMIAVTSFFRDGDFYESLEAQLDRLESVKDTQIRVWVAGCSKGQEAYSLAILLMEYRSKKQLNFSIKVFATDLNSSNIEYAGRGYYTKSEVDTVPDSLREKYFTQKNGLFLVRDELRECLIFSAHDLISSPPFSNMNLVSCRNLLIYLTPSSQAKAISNLVFSLRVGGILALGPSETLGAVAPSMLVMDGKWRIFKKIKKYETFPMSKWEQPKSLKSLEVLKRNIKSPNRSGGSDFSLNVLESLFPRALVINEQFEILAIFGDAHKLLNKTPRGIMSLSIESLFDPKIQLPITSILLEAKQNKSKIRIQAVPINEDGLEKLVELVIQAIPVQTGELFYICELSPSMHPVPETIKNTGDTSDIIASLQVELHECRNELNATIAVTEESNEELQTTNEELISSNEELQSTNEELNSVNEELYTLNTEFQEKISQLAVLNADLENLINALNIGVIYLDEDFHIRRVTAQVDVVLNVKMIDIGRSLFDLKSGQILRPIQERVKRGEKIDHYIEYAPENGRYYLIRVTNFLDNKTKDHGYILTVVDISESKKNEIFLEETQKVAKIGGWIIDLATMIPTWSRQVYAIHEVQFGAPIDISLAINFYAPKERERIESYISACKQGVPYEDTFEFITAKGRNIWVRATGRPVYGDHGEITMLRGTLQDITEMRISDQQQSLALDVTQTGVWTWDYLSGKLHWDKQMYLLYGKTPTANDLTFQDWRECVNPDDLARFERDMMDSVQKHTLFSSSFQIRLPNGDMRWIACTAKGLYDQQNNLSHVIGVNRDQTEELNLRKAIEEERTRNQQAMKMASIGELASGIGHEVNNPLAIMISNLQLLQENLPKDESSQQMLKKTLEAGSRIRDIVDGLRSLSRDQSHEQARIYEVHLLIQGVYGLLNEIYKKEGITLIYQKSSENMKIKVRFGAVQQVLMNLISNARDAMINSKIKTITISAKAVQESVQINITDTGCGIPHEQIENIFKAFYTTKEVGKGTGLGLSISKKIIQNEGGEIKVESVENKGTTFSISFPSHAEIEKIELIKEPRPLEPEKTKINLKNKVVLIVDDEHELRKILRFILSRKGMIVVEAVDGEDAWNIWQKQHFDFLVTDLNMPRLSGPQLIAKVMDHNPNNASIFVLTGGVRNDWNIVGGKNISSAITNTIPKPFTIELLLEILTSGRGE